MIRVSLSFEFIVKGKLKFFSTDEQLSNYNIQYI